MKQILLLIPIALAAGSSAWANGCVSEALSIYDSPGFTCSLGDLTFSDFKYSPTSSGGAVAPPDTSVTVNTITSGFGAETGLEFVSAWLAGSGQTIDSSISFDVSTSDTAGITDLELYVAGGADGQGVASVAEVAPTPPVNLYTSFQSGSANNLDKTTFPPADVFSLSLTKDIGLAGGMAGTAHISDVYNLFSEGTTTMTPEPSLLVLCVGALGLVPVVRRKFAR